jgi:hypothetical protein
MRKVVHMNLKEDGNGGLHLHLKNVKPQQLKTGIGLASLVTLIVTFSGWIWNASAKTAKYDAACKKIEALEIELGDLRQLKKDVDYANKNIDEVKTLLMTHMGILPK